MTGRVKRVALSAPVAVCLALVIAGGAMAATWSAPIPLTSSGSGFGDGIDQIDGTSAVVSYVEWNGDAYDVKVTRSTTMGATWEPPQTLSTDGYDSDVSALGLNVDVVWSENGRVMYARSGDSGVTYDPPVPLSPAGGFPINLSVARGPGGVAGLGLVEVAWQNGNTNAVKVRTSDDGGATWSGTASFATHIQDMGTAVAIYNGVFHLAYKTNYNKLKETRSVDGGNNWTAPVTITTDADGVVDEFSITASGEHVYIVYADQNVFRPRWGTMRYRHSPDSGATWEAERNLTPKKWKTSHPDVELYNGVLRVTYGRKTQSGLSVWYQESADGLVWSTPEVVDSTGHDPLLTYAGNVIVLFEVGTGDAFVRTGT